MSDNRTGESKVLNWRGPLLAAAIFAIAFAILLLMAHQNESNASDMGSSLRQDPYGASLLFGSYERAGYQVERSQDEDSLSVQNASRTTAFFIGGVPPDEWQMENGKPQPEKFRGRLEKFLERGGRVVVVAPTFPLMSKSQGWEFEDEWNQAPDEATPTWVSPDSRAMPQGSELMYLADDAPWLKTNAHWIALYAGAADPNADAFAPARVYMAMSRVGNGELIVASQEWFLLNETIKTHPNPVLLDFLEGGRPVVWVDETLHGLRQDQGVLWLVQRYRLQAALLLFWATLLALLWAMSGDLMRRPARDWSAEIIRHGESAGMAGQRLLQRSIAPEQVVAECWDQFRRRSPQDAQAISADPLWGPQLRAALAQPPLSGYKELTRLIAERCKAADALAHADRSQPDRHEASMKMSSEEGRTA